MKIRKIAAAFSAICLTINILSITFSAFAVEADSPEDFSVKSSGESEQTALHNEETETVSYQNYLAQYKKAGKPQKQIRATSKQLINQSADDVKQSAFMDKENVMIIGNNGGYLEYELDVPESGLYIMDIEFAPVQKKNTDIELDILVNGVIPHKSAASVKLNRTYRNKTKITQDKRGNDIRPQIEEIMGWRTDTIRDSRGLMTDPLQFYFNTGKNKVKLDFSSGNVAVASLVIYNLKDSGNYQEYAEQNKDKPNYAENFNYNVQGEDANIFSHPVLYPTYDKSNVDTVPSDHAKLRLNTIGQGNWKMPGQWIEWTFDVPQDGFYYISLRARQNTVRGLSSTRYVYIDDQLLFNELKNVQFSYDTRWKMTTLGQEEPYRFYLEKGTHRIRLETVAGDVGTSVGDFEAEILNLNNIYRKMIMVTGVTPDPLRDYELDKDIPNLLEDLSELAVKMRKLKKQVESSGVQLGSDAVLAEKLAVQLESFVQKPETIPERLATFRDNISSLSSWVLSLKEQPLEVDYINIRSCDQEGPKANSNFLNQIGYRFMSFISSFVEDYSYLSDDPEQAGLEVWVSLGRDQAQIIKDLIENYFVPEYNISVNLSLVQQGLLEAIAAGKGPDIALYTAIGDSVNLASRNVLVDLSENPNHEKIAAMYQSESLNPYRYNGGVYGYPLQQFFNMMFYRKDIFKELGLTPPKTWDEFYTVLTVIQKKKLLVGVPVGTPTVPDNTIFDTLLFQNNGCYYNEKQDQTMFDSEAALNAFTQWTEFYSKYSLLQTYDFYNRFRSGEMPLGIADYGMYNQLSVAAPEIEGLWEMTELPGTVQTDGSINNATTGNSTGCIMLKKIKNKEAGFRFLEWFTTPEIQAEYGIAVENILGQGGRYNPANIYAISNMNWSDKESELLLNQLEKVQMSPQIPASYYVTRNITNAFRSVVIRGENPREALYTYNVDMNTEIKRKRIEMGIDDE